MDVTALDLSPYYLHEARDNMQSWHKLRQPKLSMGGVDGSGAHFLQAAAEDIPQPDNSHDVVSCYSLAAASMRLSTSAETPTLSCKQHRGCGYCLL